jgi:hypothetical protein
MSVSRKWNLKRKKIIKKRIIRQFTAYITPSTSYTPLFIPALLLFKIKFQFRRGIQFSLKEIL